jgi:regulatory protein
MGAPNWKSTASKKNPASGETGRIDRPAGPEEEKRPIDAAKQAAYRILSYRDRSAHELREKLKEKGFSEEVIAEVVPFLEGIGALNDLRFAGQWVRSRTDYRHLGPVRLRRELLEKGISAVEADAALRQLSEERDPLASAEEALTRRFHDPALLEEPAVRQRAFAFLQRKGFSTETILKVFRKIRTP